MERVLRGVERLWGTEDLTALINPALADDREFTRENARRLRASATPRAAVSQYRYILERDARAVLPVIQAPTLVLHTSRNPVFPLAHGRYLADHIAGARLLEFPGAGVMFDDGQGGAVLADVSEFLTGHRPAREIDRLWVTVLLTDIVASTEHVVALGDRRWRALLDSHDRAVREQLDAFDGREIRSTGDGFLAVFDGPGRAVRCAQAITDSVRTLGIEIRAGLHTGECDIRRGDLAGRAIHIAARVGALAGPSEVLVTDAVKTFLDGSDFAFRTKMTTRLKGLPDTWELHAVR